MVGPVHVVYAGALHALIAWAVALLFGGGGVGAHLKPSHCAVWRPEALHRNNRRLGQDLQGGGRQGFLQGASLHKILSRFLALPL